jgi:Asp-tRNA(Asn)/Glu-tRNA(Gln) amidotransferase A subunit family amidase
LREWSLHANGSRSKRPIFSVGGLLPAIPLRMPFYTQARDGGARGLRIGVVKEGFGHPSSERNVDAKVMAGAQLFKKLGASVDEISVAMHLLAAAIWLPIAAEGATYAKAQNLKRKLRAAYDAALSSYDLLRTPHPAGIRDGPEYRALQRQRTSRDHDSLRDERRPADRVDAGRRVLRRVRHLPRRRGVRGRGRLEQNVIQRRGLPCATAGRSIR